MWALWLPRLCLRTLIIQGSFRASLRITGATRSTPSERPLGLHSPGGVESTWDQWGLALFPRHLYKPIWLLLIGLFFSIKKKEKEKKRTDYFYTFGFKQGCTVLKASFPQWRLKLTFIVVFWVVWCDDEFRALLPRPPPHRPPAHSTLWGFLP